MTVVTQTLIAAEIKGVLFDLDGTLVDTAPDLIAALNMSLESFAHPPVSLEEMRHVASNGSLALAKAALPDASEIQHRAVQQGLLDSYAQVNGDHCQLFDGVAALLDYLDQSGIPYGIVTNKAAKYTRPLIHALSLTQRMKTVISGDSTLFSKPHTAPMLLAAQQLNCQVHEILYLGDAERDLIAAADSAMLGGVAQWGYIDDLTHTQNWPGEFSFESPTAIIDFFIESISTRPA
ncbi:HAD family hydrolase [Shewanella atlantica]|uniref:HAD family hydrolase n=1 Tax=Shewanella atlantica TaxID=271099 RepID=A0A3S0RPM0_9GAMM|nr:HAD-IA family hydrolase [Shewanella atlantica]RTR33428.1 HAD family hydrolase [Shewanella atlantica]